MITLDNKVAVITGCSNEISKSIARKLNNNGVKVVLIDYNLKNTDEIIPSKNEDVLAIDCDIRDRSSIQKQISNVLNHFGQINILINNVVISQNFSGKSALQINSHKIIDINLQGLINITQEIVPYMKDKYWGKIINVSLDYIYRLNMGSTYYNIQSKLKEYTKTLARDLGSYSINCFSIEPGFIITDETLTYPDIIISDFIKETALNRAGYPEDIAELIVFLSSEEARFITGVNIPIDGGAFTTLT